jgi:hypothetical protein
MRRAVWPPFFRPMARPLSLAALAALAGCSSGASKADPSASAQPSYRTTTARPPSSERSGPSYLEDIAVPSATPLPVASTPPGPPRASCDMRAMRGVCVDFFRPVPGDKSDCENALINGKYAASPCPSDKSIGYCTMFDGNRRHYYDVEAPQGFGSGVDDAKISCESRRFVPAK